VKRATANDYERVTAAKDSPLGGLAAIRARNGATRDAGSIAPAKPKRRPVARTTVPGKRLAVVTPLSGREARAAEFRAALDQWYRANPWARQKGA
jgi:hypothetical protein